MAATLAKLCPSCREQHVFFLPIGNAAEPMKRYEYTCPKQRSRVTFAPAKGDIWKRVDSKTPGYVVIREVIARS